ncbi:protein Notchless-like [Dysidea avara]|uniref:protein Notchless-like n=1 Tax=Dysidea avara TaxID=196820 RepID=UPI0033319311
MTTRNISSITTENVDDFCYKCDSQQRGSHMCYQESTPCTLGEKKWDTKEDKAHCHWILSIAWSPDGKKIASGCKAGKVCIWDSVTGKQLGKFLTGHRQWITWLSWRPMHQEYYVGHYQDMVTG